MRQDLSPQVGIVGMLRKPTQILIGMDVFSLRVSSDTDSEYRSLSSHGMRRNVLYRYSDSHNHGDGMGTRLL